MAEAEKLDLGEEKPKSSAAKIIFIVLGAVLLTLALVFATLYFMGIFPSQNKAAAGHEQAAAEAVHAEPAPLIYEHLTPPFVANFKNNPEARALQVEISIASRDQSVLDAVKKHNPIIRNNLLLLLSGQDLAVLKTTEGKEALRVSIKEEIKKVVVAHTDKKDGVDEVFFTGFIMQ